MEYVLQQISNEQKELEALNQQLSLRAAKFGSEFTQLTLNDYKLFKIQKARQTGKIKYLQNILLEEVVDLKERKDLISNRLKRFYPEIKVQDTDKYFAQRQDIDPRKGGIAPRPNAWHLFGVDYMSNDIIRQYFHTNPNFKIQWINDSSCNIAFNTVEQAQQALKHLITGQGMRDQSEIWYQLPDYEVDGVKRKLVCRIATSADAKKQQIHGHDSKYYQWKLTKQKLGKFVKKTAHSEIKKTKFINRQNKHHNTEIRKQKQEKQQEEEESQSSSLESIMKDQQ